MADKTKLSKSVIKKLADDLQELISSEEGCLLALELFESIPEQARYYLIKRLSTVHTVEVATFCLLIQREYEDFPLADEADRALKKLQMAGVNVDNIELKLGLIKPDKFALALASKTRLTGQVNLLMAFKNEDAQTYNAFFFLLSFGDYGIKEFFRSTELTEEQLQTAKSDNNYVKISFEQSLTLLNQSYSYNKESKTLPAIGLVIYKDLLKLAQDQKESVVSSNIIDEEASPEMLVNSFCLAQRQGDVFLVKQLSDNRYGLKKEGVILQSKIIDVRKDNTGDADSPRIVFINTEVIFDNGVDLNKIGWSFKLERTAADVEWEITSFAEVSREKIPWEWLEESLSKNTISAIYEVYEWENVQMVLDTLDGMELFQAGEDTLFYKWWDLNEVLKNGINLREGVCADFILYDEDLVVLTSNIQDLNKVKDIFQENLDDEVQLVEDGVPVDIEYKILDEDNISFSQLTYQWELSGEDQEEKVTNWLHTKLADLNGMTPVEAKDSSEGSHLLWSLFKDMQRNQVKLRRKGDRPLIDYRQFIKAVGWGKKQGDNFENSQN